MKIGIVGATGSFGKGLAYRWVRNHKIYIGSRYSERGKEKAKDYQLELQKYGADANMVGTGNHDAIVNSDVVVLSVKFEHVTSLLTEFGDQMRHKIVISPIVALTKGQNFQYVPPPEGSVALLVQKMLPDSAVVAALHTIPAHRLQKPDTVLEGDVPVCSDDSKAKDTIFSLIQEIEQLNPIDAGPLGVSAMVEPIVPLILNLKQYGLKQNTSIKFI
jgi:NADPH-dependent F420 reductase